MAENPLIDLAQTVMIEKYGLDEETYKLFKFSETAKAVTIGMTNDEIPVTATFPRLTLRYEEMKRWEYSKKELYVKGLIQHGEELPEELHADFEFEQLYTRIAMDNSTSEKLQFDLESGDRIVLKLNNGDLTVEEGQDKLVEESAEEFESKVEGKKRKLKKK